MPIDAARAFDKERNFAAFWTAEPVGAARWIAKVMANSGASAEALKDLPALLSGEPNQQDVASYEVALRSAGEVLTKLPAQFDAQALRALGWVFADEMKASTVRGIVRVQHTTEDLKRRVVVAIGQIVRPLICNDEALESFAGDLSVFEGAFEVALVGWPDSGGQFFVEEAAPVMMRPGRQWYDWAQGRLFDNGDKGKPVVLRVNADRQIAIGEVAIQEQLRPFVGTAVVLYGSRVSDETGIRIESVEPDMWFLTRLTDPADAAAGLPAAARPSLQNGGALCIGATPPWNWKGPNVRTHLLCPHHAASLIDTEERRIIFGRPLAALPDGWVSPIPEVKRVVQVQMIADRAIDTAVHISTRRAPRGALVKSILGVAMVTSAEHAFSARA